MAADLIDVLVRTTLTSSAAILLVLMLRRPVRLRFGAGVAYALWAAPALAAAALLVPPRQVIAPAEPGAEMAAEFIMQAPAAAAASLDAGLLLSGLWALGALAALGVIVWRQRRFIRLLGALEPTPDGQAFVAANAGVGPALVGTWAPKVVLPADFEQRFSPEERQVMLGHERAHLRAGDTRINTAVALAQCLYWFNPLVHVAAHFLRLDQELACDAAVVARYPDQRRCYAETMLKAQFAPAAPPLGCYWPARGVNPLRVRIAMLKRELPDPGVVRWGAASVLALSLAGGVAAWAAQPPTMLAGPPPMVTASVDRPAASEEELRARSRQTALTFLNEQLGQVRGWEPSSERTALSAQIEDSIASLTQARAGQPEPVAQSPIVVAQQAPTPPPVLQPRVAVAANPEWMARPSAADLARVYPERAARLELGGRVRLRCRVGAGGTVENCTVVSETPPELGFGEAAMRLAPLFRMNPVTREGELLEGAWVQIPIQFRFGDPPPAASAPEWRELPEAYNLRGRAGRVRLRCRVRADGKLEECSVASETPEGQGLGDDALRIASDIRMKPQTENGIPVDGAWVNFPIVFKAE